MKPINQTICNFKNGNCMQACIASILELPLKEVPNLMEKGNKFFDSILINYFSHLNIGIINIHPCYEQDLMDCYLIAIGTSPRNKKKNHAVVWYNGEIAHDPHPDKTGIIGDPKSFWIFTIKNPARIIIKNNGKK